MLYHRRYADNQPNADTIDEINYQYPTITINSITIPISISHYQYHSINIPVSLSTALQSIAINTIPDAMHIAL